MRSEAAFVGVAKVVGKVAAVIVQRFGHLAFGRGDQVFPETSVIELDFRLDRPVRIDLVAGVDEEVRVEFAHRLVNPIAPHGFVDAPTLPGLVAGKGEHDIARPVGRRAEPAGLGHAVDGGAGQVLKLDTVEMGLSRSETAQVDPGREIAGLKGGRPDDPAHVRHRLGCRYVNDHARGPVSAAPDDRPAIGHISAHDAVGHLRTCRLRRDHCGSLPLGQHAAQTSSRCQAAKCQ